MRFRWQCGSVTGILLLAAYFALVMGLVFHRHLPVEPAAGLPGLFRAALPALAFFAAGTIAGALLLWPYVGKVIFTLFILLAGVLATATFALGLEADWRGAEQLLSALRRPAAGFGLTGAVWMTLSGLLPAAALCLTHIEYRPLPGEIARRAVLLALGCLALFALAAFTRGDAPIRRRRGLWRRRAHAGAVHGYTERKEGVSGTPASITTCKYGPKKYP